MLRTYVENFFKTWPQTFYRLCVIIYKIIIHIFRFPSLRSLPSLSCPLMSAQHWIQWEQSYPLRPRPLHHQTLPVHGRSLQSCLYLSTSAEPAQHQDSWPPHHHQSEQFKLTSSTLWMIKASSLNSTYIRMHLASINTSADTEAH